MSDVIGGILKPLSTILGGGKTKTIIQKPPEPEPEPVMPVPDDAAAAAARRRQVAASRQRSGRLSTILTDGAGETLG